jgi:hypothetical protein
MTEADPPAPSGADTSQGEPKRSRLGQILAERPEARPQLRNAVSSLIGTSLFAFAVIGILLIWHFKRRAQLIRERLSPPRKVSLPDVKQQASDETDRTRGQADSLGS